MCGQLTFLSNSYSAVILYVCYKVGYPYFIYSNLQFPYLAHEAISREKEDYEASVRIGYRNAFKSLVRILARPLTCDIKNAINFLLFHSH